MLKSVPGLFVLRCVLWEALFTVRWSSQTLKWTKREWSFIFPEDRGGRLGAGGGCTTRLDPLSWFHTNLQTSNVLLHDWSAGMGWGGGLWRTVKSHRAAFAYEVPRSREQDRVPFFLLPSSIICPWRTGFQYQAQLEASCIFIHNLATQKNSASTPSSRPVLRAAAGPLWIIFTLSFFEMVN